MKIIAFSDLHSEEHEDFSYQLPNGTNSRLADCLSVVDKVAHYRDKYGCRVVLFAGDLFHTPSLLSTVVFQETYKKLEALAETSKRLILMAGNHDMASITADGDPISTVYATGRLPNTTVVVGKQSSIVLAGNEDETIHCLPYIKDSSQLDANIAQIGRYISSFDKGINIIATHIGLDQALNGPNEIQLKHAYAVSKLKRLGAQMILSGHHHHPEDHPAWSVIGAPLQMNMNDRGDKRGLLIYDTKRKEMARIWLRGSHFHLYEINSRKALEKMKRDEDSIKGGYVRVLLTQGTAQETEVAKALTHTRMYKIIPVRASKSAARSEMITNKAIANVGNLGAVIPDYVDHVKQPGLNPKRLISIGRKLVKGVS